MTMDQSNIDKARALRLVRKLRERAYPPMAEYLDGMVKGSSDEPDLKSQGEAQVAAYCAACLQVKRTYPKPE